MDAPTLTILANDILRLFKTESEIELYYSPSQYIKVSGQKNKRINSTGLLQTAYSHYRDKTNVAGLINDLTNDKTKQKKGY